MVDNIEEFREMMKDPEFEKHNERNQRIVDATIVLRRLGLSDDLIMEVVLSALATPAPIEKEKS